MINLIFVARPAKQKGLAVLMHAIQYLGRSDLRLNVVGEICTYDSNVINDLELRTENLVLHGRADWHKVAELMRSSDILVVPSLYETFGNVAIEGMSCGCVIIASRTGGLISFVQEGENGFLFEPGNSMELSGAIQKCTEDPQWMIRSKQKSIDISMKYSWNNVIKATLELFESVIRQSSQATD